MNVLELKKRLAPLDDALEVFVTVEGEVAIGRVQIEDRLGDAFLVEGNHRGSHVMLINARFDEGGPA